MLASSQPLGMKLLAFRCLSRHARPQQEVAEILGCVGGLTSKLLLLSYQVIAYMAMRIASRPINGS